MNEIVNQFLLAGDKFMPKMYLKQPRFTYSASGSSTKNKVRIEKFKETGDTNYIYKDVFGKACFHHDMAYGDFQDLGRRTAYDEVLRDKAFNIAKNPKYDGYQRGLVSMVYKFFDKKPSGGVNIHANDKTKQNQRPLDLATHQVAKELHKPIIKKSFKNNGFNQGSKTMFGVLI